MLQAGSILLTEYKSEFNDADVWTPEKRLHFAVLARALQDATFLAGDAADSQTLKRLEVKAEALEWLRYGTIGTVTFDACCCALADDPADFADTIRKRVLSFNIQRLGQ